MAYERCVGLQVVDEALYGQYRQAMLPILTRFGGRFRYDFKIHETLKSETAAPINRVFVIAFESKADNDAFFKDPDYLKVRETFYKPSVAQATTLAAYER